MNLKTILQNNIKHNLTIKAQNIITRQKYIDEHYGLLQKHITNILTDYSKTSTLSRLEIDVHLLYAAELGKKFREQAPENNEHLPTREEVIKFTTKLEQFLRSEGLKVHNEAGRYLKVNWE